MSEVREGFLTRVESWRKRAEVVLAPLVNEAAASLNASEMEAAATALLTLAKDAQVDEEVEGWTPEDAVPQEPVSGTVNDEEDGRKQKPKGKGKGRVGRPRKEEAVYPPLTTLTPSVLSSYVEASPAAMKRKRETVDAGKREARRNDAWHEVNAVLIELPSSHDPLIRDHTAMRAAALIEKSVREVDAAKKLDTLRQSLITSASLRAEAKQVRGQYQGTRARNAMKRKWISIQRTASSYRRGRTALVRLGMPEDDRGFKPLRKEDVKAFVVLSSNEQLGDSRKKTSWIWENLDFVGPQQGEKMHDYCVEGTLFKRDADERH